MINPQHAIAYGSTCLWWGPISETKIVFDTDSMQEVLLCPRCGGPCDTCPTEHHFLDIARRFELLGFVGHQRLIAWSRGMCFKTRGDAWAAFISEKAMGRKR